MLAVRSRPSGTAEPRGSWHTAVAVPALALLVVATRLGSSLVEVIDWDECTFMLVAQSILRGHLPYAEVFDIKPPLLFFLLAGAMRALGESLATVRVVGDVCVFGTAWATYAVARRCAPPGSSLLGAALVITAGSAYFGRYTSTEWPAAMFAQASLLLLLAGPRSPWRACLAGACLSLATLSRTNYAFVAVAGLAVTVWNVLDREAATSRVRQGMTVAVYVLGALVPLALVVVLYAARHQVDLLALGAITAPAAYALSALSPLVTLLATLGNLFGSVSWRPWTMGPLSALAILGVHALRAGNAVGDCGRRRQGVPFAVFLGATLLSIAANGSAFSHHLVMLLPYLGVLASVGLGAQRPRRWLLTARAVAAAAVVVALVVRLPDAWTVAFGPGAGSPPIRRIAERVAEDMRPGDGVWALTHHILLFYLDVPPVSPLVGHPGNFPKDSIHRALSRAGRIPADERERLLSRPPRYVFTGEERPFYMDASTWARLAARLAESYEPWIRADGYVVYRRR